MAGGRRGGGHRWARRPLGARAGKQTPLGAEMAGGCFCLSDLRERSHPVLLLAGAVVITLVTATPGIVIIIRA